jgi:hypothetical protein
MLQTLGCETTLGYWIESTERPFVTGETHAPPHI